MYVCGHGCIGKGARVTGLVCVCVTLMHFYEHLRMENKMGLHSFLQIFLYILHLFNRLSTLYFYFLEKLTKVLSCYTNEDYIVHLYNISV